jgi:hypothetical protein
MMTSTFGGAPFAATTAPDEDSARLTAITAVISHRIRGLNGDRFLFIFVSVLMCASTLSQTGANPRDSFLSPL